MTAAETTAGSQNVEGDRRTAGIVLAAATVAMGLIAGLYFGWAVSVMPGLAGLDDRAFVDAMQQLDDAIRDPLFFATLLAALVLPGVAAYLHRRLELRQASGWILAALILYGIGVLTTMAINEPLNMDLVDPGDPSQIADPAGVRDAFEDKWVAWHIVRTVLTTAALGSLAYALLLHGRAEREPAQRNAGAGDDADRHRGASKRPQGATMTNSIKETKPILVLGGTGKTGRRVAARLATKGLPVRIGSRSGEPAFDWEDHSTWADALEGAGSAYVSYYPDLAVPGAAEAVGSFAELAVKRGVPRLVLLSGRGEPEAEQAEQAARDSGAEFTIVRSAWFAQNFSESYMLDGVLSGELALPAGDTPEPFVDADDIAEVAVASLTEGGHAGELYELTGPRLLTFAEAVDEISRAAGREIRYMPISIEEFVAAAYRDVPGEVIDLLTYLFGEVLDGRNVSLADGVQRALGREPRDFADFARNVAASGIWTPSPVTA